MDTFAERLRKARERRGMKRTVLSELAGLRRNAVADYENGRRTPSADALLRLAQALQVSSDYLLGITQNF